METNTFISGDVVNLKCDKHIKMVVESVSGNTCTCIWLDCTNELVRHDIASIALEKSN